MSRVSCSRRGEEWKSALAKEVDACGRVLQCAEGKPLTSQQHFMSDSQSTHPITLFEWGKRPPPPDNIPDMNPPPPPQNPNSDTLDPEDVSSDERGSCSRRGEDWKSALAKEVDVCGVLQCADGKPLTSQHHFMKDSQSTHSNTPFEWGKRLPPPVNIPDMNTPPPPWPQNKNTFDPEDVSSDERKSCSRRGGEWKSEEDRALAKEVNACGVLQCAKGKSAEKWEEVSVKLQHAGSFRTGKSCKSRFSRLLAEHRAQNLRSIQKNGTNEEISMFLHVMENLNGLAEVQSRDPHLRTQARERQKKLLEEQGQQENEMRWRAVRAFERETIDNDQDGPKKKRKRTLDELLEGVEEEFKSIGDKMRKIEEQEEARHKQLIEETRKSTAAVQDLCRLLETLVRGDRL